MNEAKRVLVACEESQTVTKAFRDRGHEAFSCDIVDPSGGLPAYHLKGDVLQFLDQGWDLMIAHPPCTYLTTTGNRWFDVSRYGDKAIQRAQLREEAVEFFMALANAPIPQIAIENPVGIMSSRWRKPNQTIQPYQFGHDAAKRTCLWLKGLPLLKPTDIVEPTYVTYSSGKRMSKWYADVSGLPSAERTKARSKTFEGIAKAMADQWSR